MDLGFYGVFMIAGVLAVQFFFSTRDNLYLGAILPVAYIAFLTWMLATNQIENPIAFFLYLLVGLLFLIAEWSGGRKYLHGKRNRELAKMKARDIR